MGWWHPTTLAQRTPRKAKMRISNSYNPQKPYKTLMKGRPEESASWQSIAVYDQEEYREARRRGWKDSREFMEMADRARGGDDGTIRIY